MSKIKPFKGLRPKAELASRIAALPYDVMSSAEAREMVKDDPYSFLHIDRAEIDLDESLSPYDPLVYVRARENLVGLVKSGALVRDDDENFYIYRLTMNGRAQTGVVACASVDEYLNGSIKKHELTRADKEQDRINHVAACNANTGPIFLTYRGRAEINAIAASVTANSVPVYDFVSDDGIGHTCWAVSDRETVMRLRDAFAAVPALYIADGHHRNASAVRVAQTKRKENPGLADAEFNYYLSVIFPAEELNIMDYNRVIRSLNGLSEDGFLEILSENFDIELCGEPCGPAQIHTFGMYLGGRWYLLRAKAAIINESDPIAALDVSILQENVLAPVLGIDDPRTSRDIDFVGGMRGLNELSRRVDSGEMRVAFSMFPTSMEELMAIADAGLIMPPKSTWFEPKLRSGLFIHELD